MEVTSNTTETTTAFAEITTDGELQKFASAFSSLSNDSGNSTDFSEVPGADAQKETLAVLHQWTVTITLIVIMLGMGATLTVKEIWSIIRRPYGVIIGAVSQFLIMPLCGFAVAHATSMSAPHAIGTLIICCCPGGSSSNIFCYWSDGDVVLSICMTSCSTLLAVGMMPLCLFIYSRSWTEPGGAVIPYANIMISLAYVVIPAAIGCLCKYKLPKVAKYIPRISSIIAMIGILATVVLVILRSPDIFGLGWQAWVAASVLPACGFCLGYILSTAFRLSRPKRRTVALETGLQNVTLAMSLITMSFSPSRDQLLMMMVPALFAFFMNVEAIIFVAVYRCVKRFCSKSTEPEKEGGGETVAEDNGIARASVDELTLDEVKGQDAKIQKSE